MLDNLKSLLEDQIKDLYSAENQLIKALPKMAKAANSDTLKNAFDEHLVETKQQVERLQEIAETLGMTPGGKKCKAMEGLLEEGKEVMEEDGEEFTIDAGLVAAAQRVEHYEISAYGSARAIAERIGEAQVAELLQATLDEESAADKKLTSISEGELLPSAPTGAEEEEPSAIVETTKPKKKVTNSRGRSSR